MVSETLVVELERAELILVTAWKYPNHERCKFYAPRLALLIALFLIDQIIIPSRTLASVPERIGATSVSKLRLVITDYGRPMKPSLIEILNFWALSDKLTR